MVYLSDVAVVRVGHLIVNLIVLSGHNVSNLFGVARF